MTHEQANRNEIHTLVHCLGRGRKNEGCGLVYGKSGSVCANCGGMLLSSEALVQAKLVENSMKEKEIE